MKRTILARLCIVGVLLTGCAALTVTQPDHRALPVSDPDGDDDAPPILFGQGICYADGFRWVIVTDNYAIVGSTQGIVSILPRLRLAPRLDGDDAAPPIL